MSLNETSFRKFKDDFQENGSQDEKETPKQKFLKLKRKPKYEVYNDCKFDFSNFLYINHKVQRYVRHSQLPNMTLENYPVVDAADLSQHNYPYYTMSEPYPIYIARKHCEAVDPCFRRTITRTFYRNRNSQARTYYQNALKNSQKLRKLEKEDVYCPAVFTFAERLECNPDPYFYGNYDFYYTGGNLCVLSNEEQYILHVDDKDHSTIRASIFPPEQFSFNVSLNEFATKRLSNDGEIFQISPLIDMNDHMITNNIGVRQRNNMTILKILPETKKIKVITEFRTKNTPFISFAQSADNPRIIVLTTMKENIRIYDINRKDVTLMDGSKFQEDEGHIGWNNIQFWKNQSFLYANERQLSIMDFRTPKEDWLKTSCTFSTKEFPCELISSLAKSQFENLFYVGTSHKLRCLDTRFLPQEYTFENSSVCEWTHQLDYPPLLLDVCNSKKREHIACASPIAGDLRLCELKRNIDADCLTESVFKSYCLPWQPPTLQEAYGSACLTGKTLQPEADFKQRIRCCTTGLAFSCSKEANKRPKLMLWANSNGDVYAQRMKKRHSNSPRITERSNEIMAEYASKVSEVAQPDLNYTDVVDFKAMRKVLLSKVLAGNLSKAGEEPVDLDEKTNSKKRFKGSWQKSMTTLHSYKDALVQDLLSIWDIPKEEEIDIKFSALKKKFKEVKRDEDILKWLNTEQTTAVAPTTIVPITNLKMSAVEINENEFLTPADISQPGFNTTDTTNYLDESRYEMDGSMLEISTAPKRPKIAKAKKKHVKGF